MAAINYIDCEASLDISSVETLHHYLLNALAQKDDVVLNAQHIVNVDDVGLQLICAFINDAKSQGLNVSWEEPTDILIQKARQLGLAHMLALI